MKKLVCLTVKGFIVCSSLFIVRGSFSLIWEPTIVGLIYYHFQGGWVMLGRWLKSPSGCSLETLQGGRVVLGQVGAYKGVGTSYQ